MLERWQKTLKDHLLKPNLWGIQVSLFKKKLIIHTTTNIRNIYYRDQTLSKAEEKNPKIYFDGEKIKINGYEPPRNPVIQAQAQKNGLQICLKNQQENHSP